MKTVVNLGVLSLGLQYKDYRSNYMILAQL